jgi:hypothetical protein
MPFEPIGALSHSCPPSLSLLACKCLVAQDYLLPCSAIGSRALAQTGHSRCSLLSTASPRQQLACLCLAHRYHRRNTLCPATACEPRSICVVPCTPSSLCTCKLACQTAANDVVATAPAAHGVSSCSSPLRTPRVPAFVLPRSSCALPGEALLSHLDLGPFCRLRSFPAYRSATTLVFHTLKWTLWSSDPHKAARRPSAAQAASRSAPNRTVNRHSICAIGHLRHCLSLETRRRKFGRCEQQIAEKRWSAPSTSGSHSTLIEI